MRTIAIINQKGGCGKTTSAINLAACFAARQVRTLLIDMDPQSHCAAGLGIPEQSIEHDISSALLASPSATLERDTYVWQAARHLDLVPSTMMLAAVESQRGGLADQPDKEKRLKSVIERLSALDDEGNSRYDLCVIDCPPSIGLLSYNALAAAKEILIPVETSYFSLQGAQKQIQTVRSMGRRVGSRLHPRLFATMHAPEQKLSRDLLTELRSRFGDQVIPIAVRYDPALREAASMGQPIGVYAPDSGGSEDYQALSEWLMEHASIDRVEHPDDAFGSEPGFVTQRQGTPGREPQLVGALPSTDPGARASEIAQRARAIAAQRIPMPRSMMPHRPVAIQVVDDRVVDPVTTPQPLDRVRHLLGVRRVTGGALFVQPLSIGKRVFVAGSFNGWSPSAHELKPNEALGIFEAHVELPSGEHEYKLVVDGRWDLDPHNDRLTKNASGHINNLIEHAPEARRTHPSGG